MPYFQKAGFAARVVLNYRGDYRLVLEYFRGTDVYVADRTTMDVNASYEFNGLIAQPTLLVQVDNLINEPEIQYGGGNEDRLLFHNLSGRTVPLGLSMEL